ncbi:MAG TPA: aminotransferase class I/II-fold pyridoxal phosphate-dependent enzyme [Pyrinomonadaceae bacterium]|nr:aminotransferase class I/II-fold pyridoxal phosphate-dependent enzyme [Pyrinomonadaceae bacterium]
MTKAREVMGSAYMNWAKTSSVAKYNLATSGMANVKLRELRISLDDLEITNGGYGYEPLIERIATRYRVASDCVVTAAGTTFANHLAMAALIKPGDEVLFEHPAYEPMLSVVHYLGAEVKRFSRKFENGFQIGLEELESLVTPRTRLIVITNLHNPSGVLIPDSTLKQIGEIAKRVGARVLVDEVYMETLFEETPRTSFHLGNEFVVTSSLTKAFGLSGLRCGWIFAEPELAHRMWLLNDLFAATAVHAGERLSVVAMQQLADIGERAKRLLDQNRQLLNEFLDTREDLEVVRPEFGTVMFPRVRRGTSDELCRVLREKYETSVVPGSFFEMPAHFRIGIAVDTATLKAGLERLGQALDGTVTDD